MNVKTTSKAELDISVEDLGGVFVMVTEITSGKYRRVLRFSARANSPDEAVAQIEKARRELVNRLRDS